MPDRMALADEVMRLTTARAQASDAARAIYTRELANLVDDHRNVFAAALRADTDPSLERVEAMRERCAKALEDDLVFKVLDRFVIDGREVKNRQGHDLFVSMTHISDFIREKAATIRALPLTTEEPTR